MASDPSVQSAHFRPWLTIWFHPRQTIQEIINVNPLHRIYLLALLSGTASGLGNWLNAVMTDSDTFQENALWAVGYSLVAGTAITLMSCLVLQWITSWRGDRIPYSHLAAATFWGNVPAIGFLSLFIVTLIGAPLALMLLPSAGAFGATIDLLLVLAWLLFQIWSLVLTLGALSQVMRCSVAAVIGRQIGAGLVCAVPAWALYRLFSHFGDSYSGDIVLYQGRGAEAGTNLASIAVPVAALVLSLVVLFAMYRASRTKSVAASPDSQGVGDFNPTHTLLPAQGIVKIGELVTMSKVIVTLKDPGFLVGVRGIEFLLDGNHIELMQFGDTKEFDVPVGEHVATVILHGVVNRSSQELRFTLMQDQIIHIEGNYSKAWGNMSLGLA